MKARKTTLFTCVGAIVPHKKCSPGIAKSKKKSWSPSERRPKNGSVVGNAGQNGLSTWTVILPTIESKTSKKP